MANNPITRRRFLALSSLSGISVIPCVKALAQVTGVADIPKFISAAYRLTDQESLLNIEFYFIGTVDDNNAKKTGTWLKAKDSQHQTFMIVRLPQQHIAESYVILNSPDVDDCSDVKRVETRIAGYSYLVFQLFFYHNDGNIIPSGSLNLTAANLLSWNAPWMRLIVREDQAMGAHLFSKKRPLTPPVNEYPLGYTTIAGEWVFDPENFARAADITPTLNNPGPITAIEAPYRLILSPELPDHNYLFKWTYSQKPGSPYRKPGGIELWMATLQVELDPARPQQKSTPAKKPKKAKKQSDNNKSAPPPSENTEPVEQQPMAVAIIGSPDYRPELQDNNQKPDPCKEDPNFKSLPNATDRSNLVELYFVKQTILRAKTRKMAFTPLGISTHIEFQNSLYKQIMQVKPTLNLYQWKQSISFGRDQEVEVVNVVKETCFSFLMLHVRTTKRRTQCGVSFLDYKEYLIPLEHERNYLQYTTDDDTKYVKQSYKFNTPFKTIRFSSLKPKQIQVIEDILPPDSVRANNNAVLGPQDVNCRLNNPVLAFWAKQPYATAGKNWHDYLEWEFTATDWQDKEVIITKKMYLVSGVFNCGADPKLNLPLPDLQPLVDLAASLANPAIITVPYNPSPATPSPAPPDLATLENSFDDAVNKTTNGMTEWANVYHQSEQYLLEKADCFRQYLQNIFDRIETTVQAVYKIHPEWVDGQGDVEESISRFKAAYYQKILDRFQVINVKINALKDLTRKYIEDPNTSLNDQTLVGKIYHFAVIPGAYLDNLIQQIANADIKNKIKNANDELRAFTDSFDTDIDAFLSTLPPKLGLNSIKKAFQEAKQVYCFLEHVESSCKSRVNTYKKEIGVTLYKVEQGIDDLKQQLQNSLGRDWEPIYKTVEDYYHQANKAISNITTEALIFKNNVRVAFDEKKNRAMDFFDYNATRLQLHSLQGYVGKINETVNKEVLVRMSMATDYLKAQVDNEIFDIKTNGQKAFAHIHTEAKEYIKGAMRSIGQEVGGIVNPQMATDILSFQHDLKALASEASNTLSNDYKEVKGSLDQLNDAYRNGLATLKADLNAKVKNIIGPAAQKADEVLGFIKQKESAFQDQFNIQKAKLVLITQQAKSVIKDAENQARDLSGQAADFFKSLEAKILGSIKLKDILNLDTTQLPKLNKTNKSLYYNFISKNFKSIDIGSITFTATQATQLVCYFEKPIADPKAYISQTRLENFSLAIFNGRIVVEFKKLEIISNQEVKNKTSVEIGNVSFHQELAFLDALSKNIKVPGTGILLSITPQAVLATYTYSFPSIGGGAFTLANLKFMVGLTIPFPIGGGKLKPISARFGINSFDDPFVVAVSIYGGRGHFVLETTPRYISLIDFGMEFGGYLGLSLGIAAGEAHLMAGMRYVFSRDAEGQSTMSFYGYLTCGGSLTVFGFITITVTFLLCLIYQQNPSGSSLTGTASLTLSVKIGFFEKSFSLTFTKTIAGSDSSSGGSNIAYRPYHQEGYIHYADYREIPDDEEYSPHSPKQHRVFTDKGWIQYCKSFSY